MLASLSELIRPKSCVLGATFLLLGFYLSDRLVPLPAMILATLIVLLVIAFSFVLNDLYDVELDRVAKPHRPLPSGAISLTAARGLLAGLVVGAFLAALPLGIVPVLFALATLLLSAAYSLWLKRVVLMGNLTVAALNASILIFGGALVGAFNTALLQVSAGIFLYTLAHEILYALEDREGDLRGGIQTTATQLGARGSLIAFSVPAGLLGVFALSPVWSGQASLLYGAAAVLCLTLPLGWVLARLLWNPAPEVVLQTRRLLITMRFMALIPLLLLKPF